MIIFFQNNYIISTLVVTISPAIVISIETKNTRINYLKAEIRKPKSLIQWWLMEEQLTSKKLTTIFKLYGSFYQNLFESLKSADIIQLQERVRKKKPEFYCTSYRGFRNFYKGKEISSQNCSKCLRIKFIRLLFRQFAMKLFS